MKFFSYILNNLFCETIMSMSSLNFYDIVKKLFISYLKYPTINWWGFQNWQSKIKSFKYFWYPNRYVIMIKDNIFMPNIYKYL